RGIRGGRELQGAARAGGEALGALPLPGSPADGARQPLLRPAPREVEDVFVPPLLLSRRGPRLEEREGAPVARGEPGGELGRRGRAGEVRDVGAALVARAARQR